MDFRSAFWATLELHGLTATRVASQARVADAQLSYWRTGRRDVQLQTLQKLVNALPEEAHRDFLGYLGEQSTVDSVEKAIALLESSDLSSVQVARLMAAGARCLKQQHAEVQDNAEVFSTAA